MRCVGHRMTRRAHAISPTSACTRSVFRHCVLAARFAMSVFCVAASRIRVSAPRLSGHHGIECCEPRPGIGPHCDDTAIARGPASRPVIAARRSSSAASLCAVALDEKRRDTARSWRSPRSARCSVASCVSAARSCSPRTQGHCDPRDRAQSSAVVTLAEIATIHEAASHRGVVVTPRIHLRQDLQKPRSGHRRVVVVWPLWAPTTKIQEKWSFGP